MNPSPPQTSCLLRLGLKTYWSLGLIVAGFALIALNLRRHAETV